MIEISRFDLHRPPRIASPITRSASTSPPQALPSLAALLVRNWHVCRSVEIAFGARLRDIP
jgi:hypothetical protein